MNPLDRAIARHRRRSKSGARWYAENLQGPPSTMGGMLNLRMRQAAQDMAELMKRTYDHPSYFRALAYESNRQWLSPVPSLPKVPLGMALAAAAVLAPGPVNRRGFLARALAAVTGAVSALVVTPEPEAPLTLYGCPVHVDPSLRAHEVYADKAWFSRISEPYEYENVREVWMDGRYFVSDRHRTYEVVPAAPMMKVKHWNVSITDLLKS